MLGDHGKAIQYFERAMRLSPLDDDAFQSYHGISLTCFFLGHYDQAVEWSERALRDKPPLGSGSDGERCGIGPARPSRGPAA